jgi:CRISPR-associated exonuclease Cas4
MDRVQLCAQALCLEEMLGASVPEGALYYARTHKRERVVLGVELRQRTVGAVARLRELLASGVTPPGVLERKCNRCSLREDCMPGVTGGEVSAARWYLSSLRRSIGSGEPGP